MIIDKEDIFAVMIDKKVYHLGCCPGAVNEESIMHRDGIDEHLVYFCEECGEMIS